MAVLSAEEVRKMNADDRIKRLRELRQDLVHERGIAAMGGASPSPGKIRQVRRQIARILTVQNEERLGIRGQSAKAPTPLKREAARPVASKGPPARAARKAHAARPKPAPKAHKAPAKARAPKASQAKKPAAPAKAKSNAAAKASGSKNTKKEE